MIYKLIQGKNGQRYMRNGRLVSESKVPEDIIEKLKIDPVYDDSYIEPSKSCIFCGQQSKLSRFINLQHVPICEEHYQEMTVGKIVQKLREISETNQ